MREIDTRSGLLTSSLLLALGYWGWHEQKGKAKIRHARDLGKKGGGGGGREPVSLWLRRHFSPHPRVSSHSFSHICAFPTGTGTDYELLTRMIIAPIANTLTGTIAMMILARVWCLIVIFHPLTNRGGRGILFHIQTQSCSLFLCCANCIDNALQRIRIGAYRVAHCKDKEGKTKLLDMNLSDFCIALGSMYWLNGYCLRASIQGMAHWLRLLRDDRCLTTHQRVLCYKAVTDRRTAECLVDNYKTEILSHMHIITNKLTVWLLKGQLIFGMQLISE